MQKSKRQQFVEEVRKEIGTPYRNQGRLGGVAVDCAGLVVVAARRTGLHIVEESDYSMRPDPAVLLRCIRASGLVQSSLPQAAAGDMIVMRFDANPRHLAIITERQGDRITIAHAVMQQGQVVEHELTDIWRRRVFQVWRFPDFVEA